MELTELFNSSIEAIVKETEYRFTELTKLYEQFGLDKSKKQLSEDISGIIESVTAQLLDATAPKNDMEPDLYVNGQAVEIKTTSTQTWRGGTFSKRPGFYLFVSWDMVNGLPKFFIAVVEHLEESDWVESKSPNYYATTMPKKQLYKLGAKVLVGDLTPTKRGHKMTYA